MKIGTYYYPEQWPREQWERDFDKIASMGLKIVHMAEFAWMSLEPTPGEFKFDWLADCVEMAAARKLDVILCTPTAAPPVWLTQQHPEILGRDENGKPDRHGGRRHYAPTCPAMLEASARITRAMAEKFGDHPSVIGWQIDNELGGQFDQSDYTHAAFRTWLRNKYKTIDALNAAWGNQFWNQYYNDFDQILMPAGRGQDQNGYKNPHHWLDASRFWSRAWADFVKVQADILKAKVGDRWVTTNFMPLFQDCDPADMRDILTLWSWDTYPISGLGKHYKDETFRLGDPAGMETMHDHMASFNGRWGLMEVQPGQINWSGVPCLPYPGAIRLLLWTAIAHGCEFITTYRFRQPRFGIEMWHDGLIQADGVTLSPGGVQFRQVADEIKRIADDFPVGQPIPGQDAQPAPQARAGLVLDFDQMWWASSLPQAKKWSQGEMIVQWHQALSHMGLKVEILDPNQPWPDDLQVVVAPGMQMVDDVYLGNLNKYVENGGHLVLTARSGLQDRNGHFFEAHRAQPISGLIGGEVEAYDSLPENVVGTIDLDGKAYEWGTWGDLLYAEDGTRVWAKYTNMFYAGAPAITHRRLGNGSVTYCGVFGGRDLASAVIEKLCVAESIAAKPLPERVRVLRRGRFNIALNYNDKPVVLPTAPNTQFVIGGRQLEAAGVAVWPA
ncbi:MAG: beta-galactosidase [Tepidisphaeraceae bacterium]